MEDQIKKKIHTKETQNTNTYKLWIKNNTFLNSYISLQKITK